MKHFAIIDHNIEKSSVSAWVASSSFNLGARFLDDENALEVAISPFSVNFDEEDSVVLCAIQAPNDQEGYMSAIFAANEEVHREIVVSVCQLAAQDLSAAAASSLPESVAQKIRVIDLSAFKDRWSAYLTDCISEAYRQWVDTSAYNPSRFVSASATAASSRPKATKR